MTERPRVNRPIAPEEIAVVRATLERAATVPDPSVFIADLETLRVIDRCPCGCATVNFALPDAANRARPVADALGENAAGEALGILVWGRERSITELEVYDLGADHRDLGLPVIASIRPWPSVQHDKRQEPARRVIKE